MQRRPTRRFFPTPSIGRRFARRGRRATWHDTTRAAARRAPYRGVGEALARGGFTGGVAIELFLDRGNALHWIAVAVLLVSGVLTAWFGVRDGLVRRFMSTSSGVLTGERAVAAGLLYLLFGLAGVIGALLFVIRAT